MREKFLKIAGVFAAVTGHLIRIFKNPSADLLGIVAVFFAWRGFGSIYSPLSDLVLALAFAFAAWTHRMSR